MAKETTSVLTAVLHGSKAPTPQQLQRFTDFLTAKYHQPVQLTFEQNDALATALSSMPATTFTTGVWRAVSASSGSVWSS